MKKYIFLLHFVFLLALDLKASPTLTIIRSEYAHSPADEAAEIIKDIIAVIGLKPNFEVKAADIPNAAALTYNGKRYIAYNPKFISQLNAATGNKWASVSVLAHEIGHHLNGHTLTITGSKPALELEADEFSGFVLQKMGASLAQSQAAMRIVADYKTSHTHPAKKDRLSAIAKGWNAGGLSNDMAKYSKPIPSISQTQGTETAAIRKQSTASHKSQSMKKTSPASIKNDNAVLDSKFVLARVDFPSDRTANYYVTNRFNVVKVKDGQLYLLGKMMRTNNAEYPFILTSDRKATLFVDRDGKIVTSNKELAGYLRI